MYKKAFTLIEILVVLAILGIAITTVVPMMGQRAIQGNETDAFFKDLLQEHLKHAEEEGIPISITGFKGSANLVKYDGTRVSIPQIKSVQSAKINGEYTPGIEYHITVYPDGLCDYFELETTEKIKIVSVPLLMTIKREAL